MRSRRGRRVLLNVIGLVVVVLFAFPFYWMLSTAFKQPGDVQTYVPKFLPIPPTLDNFATAVTRPYFPDYVRNSVVVSISTVLLALVVGLLAAATVSRVNFRGRKFFLLLVVVAQLAPFEALLIPMYLVFRQANLLNQIPALIITYFIFTLPFTIWALRGFIDGIPIDLEESAMVDGASRFGAFRHVVLPLLGPGLVATSIFAFITAWNEFLYAYVLMRDTSNFTLPVWLSTFKTAFGTDWGGTMAASTLFTLPVLVFFLLDPEPDGRRGHRRRRQGMSQAGALGSLMLAFEGTALPGDVAARLASAPSAGITLFRFANVASPGQVRELTDAIRRASAAPPLIGADQEGGQFLGLGDGTTPFAGNMALGAVGDRRPRGARRAGDRARVPGARGEPRLRPGLRPRVEPGQPGDRDPLVRRRPVRRRDARRRDRPRPPVRRRRGRAEALSGHRRRRRRLAPQPAGPRRRARRSWPPGSSSRSGPGSAPAPAS